MYVTSVERRESRETGEDWSETCRRVGPRREGIEPIVFSRDWEDSPVAAPAATSNEEVGMPEKPSHSSVKLSEREARAEPCSESAAE